MPDPIPEYETLPPWPEPIDPTRLPAHLRDNPVMQLYLRLPPERKAVLAALADRTAAEDSAAEGTPIRELLARLG